MKLSVLNFPEKAFVTLILQLLALSQMTSTIQQPLKLLPEQGTIPSSLFKGLSWGISAEIFLVFVKFLIG